MNTNVQIEENCSSGAGARTMRNWLNQGKTSPIIWEMMSCDFTTRPWKVKWTEKNYYPQALNHWTFFKNSATTSVVYVHLLSKSLICDSGMDVVWSASTTNEALKFWFLFYYSFPVPLSRYAVLVPFIPFPINIHQWFPFLTFPPILWISPLTVWDLRFLMFKVPVGLLWSDTSFIMFVNDMCSILSWRLTHTAPYLKTHKVYFWRQALEAFPAAWCQNLYELTSETVQIQVRGSFDHILHQEKYFFLITS